MVHFFFFNIHFLSVSEHLPGFALSPQGIKDLFCFFLHFHMCFFSACGTFLSDLLPEFPLYQWLVKGGFFPSALELLSLGVQS